MNLLFCNKELDEENFNKFINGFKVFRNRDMYSIFRFSRIKEILVKIGINRGLEENLSMCSKIAPLITDGLKGNPRQVKRFLNAFMLRKKLAKVAMNDGAWFGKGGQGFVRFNFGCPRSMLEKSLGKIKNAVDQL